MFFLPFNWPNSKSEGPSWLAAVPVMALRPRSTTSAKRRIKMVPAPGFCELGKIAPKCFSKGETNHDNHECVSSKKKEQLWLKYGFGNSFGTRLLWKKDKATHEVIHWKYAEITLRSQARCGVWFQFPDASSQVLEDCMFLFAFRHANHLRGQSHQAGVCIYIYICILIRSKNRLSIYRILHTSCQLTPPRESAGNLFHTLHLPACSKIVRQQFKQMRHPGFYRSKFGHSGSFFDGEEFHNFGNWPLLSLEFPCPTPPSPLE